MTIMMADHSVVSCCGHFIYQPWLHIVGQSKFADMLNRVRELEVGTMLSVHLPPAHGRREEFLKFMQALPNSEPFSGSNQADLEAMYAQMSQSTQSRSRAIGPAGKPASAQDRGGLDRALRAVQLWPQSDGGAPVSILRVVAPYELHVQVAQLPSYRAHTSVADRTVV